jgi:hypothetical protein
MIVDPWFAALKKSDHVKWAHDDTFRGNQALAPRGIVKGGEKIDH